MSQYYINGSREESNTIKEFEDLGKLWIHLFPDLPF